MSGSIVLNIGSFEEAFLKKGFYLGENKLDSVLLSLLHLLDGGPSTVVERHNNFSYVINRKNIVKKIQMHPNKSIRYRYKVECLDEDFLFVAFCSRYGIPLDTINGIFPLRISNTELVLHSLRLAYALFLTMKMFKKENLKTNQRSRDKRISLAKGNLLSVLFLHIYSSLKRENLSEVMMVKAIKNSLSLFVSTAFDQEEVPEGFSFSLFPGELLKSLRKELSPDDFARFSFSCLQSKVLCQEVSEDFILETLTQHQARLGSPHRGIDSKTLILLREKGREFGKRVAKFYKPSHGFFPSNKATFAFPRDRGGVKGDLVYHKRLRDTLSKEDPDDRMEPYVIGLFGQPGQGKSVLINKIVSDLSSLFPGLEKENLTYQRTCHVDHWDGYRGQPIVIFDDLGQTSDGHDIQEFQTLVSCCPYVLPMADLSEKGQKFCSPIMITTSNLPYGERLRVIYNDKDIIIDDASFWRRFHEPLYVEGHQVFNLLDRPNWVRNENLLKVITSFDVFFPEIRERVDLAQKHCTVGKVPLGDSLRYQRKNDLLNPAPSIIWKESGPSFGEFRKTFKKRKQFHANIQQRWIQTVIDRRQDTSVLHPLLDNLEEHGFTESFDYKCGTGITKCLDFPAFPPSGPLPVRVEPIREPLKVRVITAGKGDTFCLKPLQRAMWHALGTYPQFCLTHGTNRLESAIERIHSGSDPGDVWISGDYSAATDSFAIEASRALLEGILESIDHEPTKRWAMKEISAHLLVYPTKTGLSPVLQQSGQLMGSLLSFPLLCLLNDCTAQFSGLSPQKYLINGDDILIRAPVEVYHNWKAQVQLFGLDLSQGKNYVHSRYGTINSQLIIDGRLCGTGKQMILDRRSRVLGECLRDLELNMPETPPEEVQELFKSVNRSKLSRTVRDINVPVSHGGLSFSWGTSITSEKSKKTAKLCYLHDLFRKLEPQKGCISIPYLSVEEKSLIDLREEEFSFNEPVDPREYHEDFLGPHDLREVSKRVLKNSDLRNLFFDQDLQTLPSLSFIRTYQIPCTDVAIMKDLQKEIDRFFLCRFLQGGQDFGYKRFREEFLLKMMNLPGINAQKTVLHLVDLMDLNISRDFLKFLNLKFDPTSFSEESFKRGLGKDLKPKEFSLPETPEFDDFSVEVVEAFNRLQQAAEVSEIFDLISLLLGSNPLESHQPI